MNRSLSSDFSSNHDSSLRASIPVPAVLPLPPAPYLHPARVLPSDRHHGRERTDTRTGREREGRESKRGDREGGDRQEIARMYVVLVSKRVWSGKK